MYAIVDIETTGGFAGKSRITEIAAYIHDGEKVVDEFQTLVNPEQVVPGYITGLTGITQEMVDSAPTFSQIAQQFHELLQDKIFVAHNVHFDYSFIKKAFEQEGFLFVNKKLCTVRLSRQVFPNQRSYSLGNLCESLRIPIENRHRASGDAKATTILFEILLNENPDAVRNALKRNSKETTLPPNLSKQEFLALPEQPGVYYFLDEKSNVIYVGKAVNIKKRITSHFSGTSKNGRNQYIRNEVHHIDYQLTGNELVALVLESQEIKRLWPKYNRSQKYISNQWGIYIYEDREGYKRFNVSKKIKGVPPIIEFNSHADGFHYLMGVMKEFELCPKLCGIQKVGGECYDVKLGNCKGACCGEESVKSYNSRLEEAIKSFDNDDRSLAILGEGRNEDEQTLIVIEKGAYLGFGFYDREQPFSSLEEAKLLIDLHKPTVEINNYLNSYINSAEAKVVELK
ncbi:MAG: exonuclease domain-containing protein [Fulvivirga sp.]|uniref:exonuclease domain-containing protein n=1 Tax=Fulvivirga sp. TaxID=1931237 RepID=UPI0032F057B4